MKHVKLFEQFVLDSNDSQAHWIEKMYPVKNNKSDILNKTTF